MNEHPCLPDAPGIYQLVHTVTADAYIGSAQNIRLRIADHMRCLRNARHSNSRMMELVQAHGISFEATVLELTSDGPRFPKEREWIEKLKPVLNGPILPPAEDNRRRVETEQVNFRFAISVIERMAAFKERHPLRPTMTQIVEAAVAEWLDANEPELPK